MPPLRFSASGRSGSAGYTNRSTGARSITQSSGCRLNGPISLTLSVILRGDDGGRDMRRVEGAGAVDWLSIDAAKKVCGELSPNQEERSLHHKIRAAGISRAYPPSISVPAMARMGSAGTSATPSAAVANCSPRFFF